MTLPTASPYASSDTPASWHCAQVYYYEPDKDALILDGIRPLYERLRGAVEAAHLARHWRRGPHLRLHVKTDPATWTGTVRPLIESVVGGYLATHPSTALPDQEAALARHRLLAEREKEPGPLTPWCPDNSIQYEPYDARLHVTRSQETADLMGEFAADSTRLLFRMLDHSRSGPESKELLALGLMLTTSVTACPPITRSFVSFRSHSEGFLHACGDPAAVREGFEAHYDARRETVTARVRAVLATLDGSADEAGSLPFVREWAALAREYVGRVGPLIDQGLVFPPMPENPSDPAVESPFRTMMFGNRAYREAVFDNPVFLRYRFLLNCTYLQINRMGLGPYHRLRTCHIAANAVEEIYGVSAIGGVRDFVERHPNQPGHEQGGDTAGAPPAVRA